MKILLVSLFLPHPKAPHAGGRYVWSRTAGMGALVARDLPPLPEGKQYCLWVVYENDWVVGGLLNRYETPRPYKSFGSSS